MELLPDDVISSIAIESVNPAVAIHCVRALVDFYERYPDILVDYLIEHNMGEQLAVIGHQLSEDDFITAAKHDSLDILMSNNCPIALFYLKMSGFRSEQDYLTLIRHIRRTGTILPSSLYTKAARNGFRRIIIYLKSASVPITHHAITAAAKNGNADLVRYLLRIKAPHCSTAVEEAIANGHQGIAMMLFREYSGYDSFIMKMAARLNLVNLARSVYHSRSDYSSALIEAAKNNNAKIAALVQTNATDEAINQALNEAAERGHVEIVLMLYSRVKSPRLNLPRIVRDENLEVVKVVASHDCPRTMAAAGGGGCLNIIRELAQGCSLTPEAYRNAISHGHYEIVMWMEQNGINITPTTEDLNRAARSGNLELVEHFLNKDVKCDEVSVLFSVEGNNSAITRLLLNRQCTFPLRAIVDATRKGNYEIVRLLFETGRYTYDSDFVLSAIREAAGNNFLDIVRLLTDRSVAYNSSVAELAANRGNLEVVKYLIEIGVPVNQYILTLAIFSKNVDLVRLLLSHVSVGGTTIIDDAAPLGPVEMIELLHQAGATFTNRAIYDAAERGHYDIVKRLVEINPIFTANAVDIAAKNGHFNVVKLLMSVNPRYTDAALNGAAENGHYQIVMYFHQLGCKFRWSTVVKVIEHSDLRIAHYLHTHGYTPRTLMPALYSSGEMVEYLYRVGVPITREFIERTISSKRDETIELLRSLRCVKGMVLSYTTETVVIQ